MLTLKDWMEVADYRITEGSDYQWNSFGHNAYSLSCWNGDNDGFSFNIVFDTKTQEVYTVEACDYKNHRAYRLINPDYKTPYTKEVKDRNIEDIAWDNVNWTDLEVDEDFIQKATAIRDGIDYDTRITIPIELADEEILFLFKQAHKADMTFNDYVEMILSKALNDLDFVENLKTKYK